MREEAKDVVDAITAKLGRPFGARAPGAHPRVEKEQMISRMREKAKDVVDAITAEKGPFPRAFVRDVLPEGQSTLLLPDGQRTRCFLTVKAPGESTLNGGNLLVLIDNDDVYGRDLDYIATFLPGRTVAAAAAAAAGPLFDFLQTLKSEQAAVGGGGAAVGGGGGMEQFLSTAGAAGEGMVLLLDLFPMAWGQFLSMAAGFILSFLWQVCVYALYVCLV